MTSFNPVTVLVVGPTTRLPDLGAFLPQRWVLPRRTELTGEPHHPDIIVLIEPAGSLVSAACLANPTASVVAVLSPFSDHDDVVRVLEAGADACVRTTNTAIVAAHVEACHRRQLASPWRVTAA
jgi:hypothetical protein